MDTPSTDRGAATGGPLSDDWCDHHFDYLAPELALNLHETLATMRHRCPVAHSDQHEGYWIVTGYDDVLRVAQDWQTFSSAHGVSVPAKPSTLVAIPEHVDPPLAPQLQAPDQPVLHRGGGRGPTRNPPASS